MPPSPAFKRKQPDSVQTTNAHSHDKKRVKINSARTILAQSSDKAINQNGELNVAAFVKARQFEIEALEASMSASKGAASTRAFQQVPKELRRRTASHNVKKVPKRLRARAAKEMKEDNTPTVTSRTKKLSGKQRLRAENGKKLMGIGALAKARKAKAELRSDLNGKPGAEGTGNEQDTLVEPSVIKTKFRKRQMHKSWLPTHLYHAKRARMTTPKEPLWRFAIPLTPTEKCYRTTHRAGGMRGCIAWDMSYMSTIGIEGAESSLLGLLRNVGVPEEMFSRKGSKWRRGARAWSGWVRESDREQAWISNATIFWQAHDDKTKERDSVAGHYEDVNDVTAREDAGNTSNQGGLDLPGQPGAAKVKRKLIVRMHPSAFLQLWSELLRAAKMQRPPAMLEDLRFEIGSIEITGPGATEALIGVLHPVKTDGSTDSPGNVWTSLANVTNPASLPENSLLAFDVSDPRLHHPPKTVPITSSAAANHDLLQTLSAWPPDHTPKKASILDRSSRLNASRLLPSQKSINRRKGDALPGAYPSPLPSDPDIPILLHASRPQRSGSASGSWTVLLPWKCVLPVWYSLMHYPLSTGGNPRFGGLQELRQILFEQSAPWFPGDFPGTKSGWEWEMHERTTRKQEWEKRPKGKRVEWSSLDLGAGRKGEIGLGWACEWERLFVQPPKVPTDETEEAADVIPPALVHPSACTSSPPHGIYHLPPLHFSLLPPTSSSALLTVRITLSHRGVPTACARIYRLPHQNPTLRAAWLRLAAPAPKMARDSTLKPSYLHQHTRTPAHAPAHVKRAALAASLLAPVPTPLPKPGEAEYPHVPDEEDLIGFVTTGNFNLGEGRGTGVGCVAVEKVKAEIERGGWCIVRESGCTVGRVGRWVAV